MKIRKSILVGTLAIVLASPLVTNLDKNEAQASTSLPTSNEYQNEKLANEFKSFYTINIFNFIIFKFSH